MGSRIWRVGFRCISMVWAYGRLFDASDCQICVAYIMSMANGLRCSFWGSIQYLIFNSIRTLFKFKYLSMAQEKRKKYTQCKQINHKSRQSDVKNSREAKLVKIPDPFDDKLILRTSKKLAVQTSSVDSATVTAHQSCLYQLNSYPPNPCGLYFCNRWSIFLTLIVSFLFALAVTSVPDCSTIHWLVC